MSDPVAALDLIQSEAEYLKSRGVYTFDMLEASSRERATYVVHELLVEGSVNLLVGDSGLGKTPLGIMLGLAVASGVPFLGRPTTEGRVLFCDAESSKETFYRTTLSVAASMGLDPVPGNFWVWSPNWDTGVAVTAERLLRHVRDLRPSLVIVDPLRAFWPLAETKTEEAMRLVHDARRVGSTWLITHHRRKINPEFAENISLEKDPHGWFQEAAGSHALVNNTDTRLGVEPLINNSAVDLVVAGFVRALGPIAPIYLARIYDDSAQAVGYRQAQGLDFLGESYQRVLHQLPQHFLFSDVKRLLNHSGSNTKRFVDRSLAAGLIRHHPGRGYLRCTP